MKRMKSITIDFGDFLDLSRGTAFPSHEFPAWISHSVDDGIAVYATLKGVNGNHESNWLRLQPIE
ncbi:MAG: hypothetical protein M0Z67_02415 [Nitrospiraceae bacterium]|nr:hypothetical protein [Nitrospiraceae bacterium]